MSTTPVEGHLSAEALVVNSKQGHQKGVEATIKKVSHQIHVCTVEEVISVIAVTSMLQLIIESVS